MPFELNREHMEKAFDLLGQYAAEEGVMLEIAVYGGSCLVLASDIRNASADVDAVFLSNASAVADLSDRVAAAMGMPQNWLNQAVRRLAPPPGEPAPNLLPFGDYPRNSAGPAGLRVHLPTPEYILAMKILSNRLDSDTEKIKLDETDAVALMRVTNITTKAALTNLLLQCYPRLPGLVHENSLTPRINAKIETMIDVYAASPSSPAPTWNAARGRPVRDDSWER